MFNTTMPTINLDAANLSDAERTLCSPIVASKGKNKGKLRASKPTESGDAAFIWRMVAFQVSPIPQHHCLPMCADFDIEVPADMEATAERFQWRRNRAKELNAVAEKIVDTIPKDQWHGVQRWHRAFFG